jgi:hypothetical protein
MARDDGHRMIRIPESLKELLAERAKANDRSMAAELRLAVSTYLSGSVQNFSKNIQQVELRDLFATSALQAVARYDDVEYAANRAYAIADAMLKARDQ